MCLVEQVIGRVGYGEAALHGAAAGALPGVLAGWIFGLLNWLDPVISGPLLTLYGLIFGALLLAAQDGRRNFASVRSMEPSQYDVVDENVADEADRLLRGLRAGAGANAESASSVGRRPGSDHRAPS